MLQMVFLSLLDNTGIVTLIGTYFGWRYAAGTAASYSRSHETEADDTGLKITARACFDTRKAYTVFTKIGKAYNMESAVASWSDSHPLPLERALVLQEKSDTINCDKDPSCQGLMARLIRL